MKTVRLDLEGRTFDVGLAHTRFPRGGSWSFFICPCGRMAKTLRLLEGKLVCRRCDGLLARCQLGYRKDQHHGDKGPAIDRLKAELDRPFQRRGKARRRLELALRRKLIVERERRIHGWRDE